MLKFQLCQVQITLRIKKKRSKVIKFIISKWNEEIIFSPSQGKKIYMYVLGNFNFR
jgi:hypothetical protein